MSVRICLLVVLFVASNLLVGSEAGIIKDVFQKITHTNNKTEDTVKQSAPICGSGILSTPDERSLSPEIIFITNRATKSSSQQASGGDRDESWRRRDNVNEVAREFRFHEENVTLAELERNGFNRDAPVSFVMHGFTSGYPLQAWISAIVEAYTIDRQSGSSHAGRENSQNYASQSNQNYAGQSDNNYREQERSRESAGRRIAQDSESARGGRVEHNLFIVNWNFAARGILYPRAVANIPIVASYVTRFVNDKLLAEAGVDPGRIQLIGHSLGAHLAGFIGKNTKSKLGQIYGLDPAGPCFGTISGPLYPASKRLAPTDAEEVITIHTNTALLGIEKPIGKYSVYVEGGSVQPGCKGGGIFKSLQTLTWDGGDFDTIACSHSRAPNLITYRHEQSNKDDDCQLVAYECKDWDSFVAGHCGVCRGDGDSAEHGSSNGPSRSVECLRIGLDWQYPKSGSSSQRGQSSGYQTNRRPNYNEESNYQSSSRRPTRNNSTQNYDQYSTSEYGYGSSSTRRPSGYQSTSGYGDQSDGYSSTRRPHSNNGQSSYDSQNDRETNSGYPSSTRRPQSPASNGNSSGNYGNSNGNYGNSNGNGGYGREPARRPSNPNQRDRRDADETSERRLFGKSSGDGKLLFLRTGDTQPYCAYHYQVILELNEPFRNKKPPMSLLLQDSESSRSTQNSPRRGQNSLSNDEFGNKFDDRTYTHLLTSSKKLASIDHGTLLFRDGLPDGLRLLKAMHVNYMSNADANVRRKLSTTLCPVRKNPGQGEDFSTDKRFYFEPCANGPGSSNGQGRHTNRRPNSRDREN